MHGCLRAVAADRDYWLLRIPATSTPLFQRGSHTDIMSVPIHESRSGSLRVVKL